VAPAAGVSTRRGVAAFDFDGTLVPGDSLHRFLARLLGRTGFSCVLAQAAPAMLVGYRRTGRDGSKAALLQHALAGQAAGHVAAVGEEFGARLASRIRPEMVTRLVWHREQGHRQLLVSASLAVYLDPFGRAAGFDDVIATRLETGPDGLLTGRLDGPNVRARQKALMLREALGPVPLELWAYGDSAGDREMLQMADHPTRVRHPRLRRAIGHTNRHQSATLSR
jgi:HAD superfamily hydrolase (TIGR01490 family)